MSESFGVGGWVLLIVVAAAICGAAYLFRARLLRQGEDGGELPFAAGEGRLEVLESAAIDGARRLVLVRCDDVEHLILVGGPADMVVAHDVSKVRGSRPLAKADELERSARRIEATPLRKEAVAARDPKPVPEAAAQPEPAEPAPKPKPAAEVQQAEPKRPPPVAAEAVERAPRPNLTAVPAPVQPPARNGQAGAAAPGRQGGEPRPAKPRQAEPQFGPRETPKVPAPHKPAQIPPANAPAQAPQRAQPAAAIREAAAGAARRNPTNREPEAKPGAAPRPASLPPAEVPWLEPDNTDADSAGAVRAEAGVVAAQAAAPGQIQPGQAQPGQPPRQPAPAVKPATDPNTTLGDLAERLEEALAREVQSAHQDRGRLDLDVDAFAFDAEPAPGEEQRPAAASEQRSRPERREAPEPKQALPKAMGPMPEPEARREPRPPADRQDEAPVISLNARRREAVDPLEDEMARLLGELTGDSNRR